MAMATDRCLGPETEASPARASTKSGVPVRELVEALTAIGSYIAAAEGILGDRTTPAAEGLGDVLDKIMAQWVRAANAARQLNKLHVHGSGDDDSPPGVCC